MTNKTPFELRYDLLSLANGMLSDKVFGERQRLENDWNARREMAITAAEKGIAEGYDFMPFPVMPTVNPDEVIELAKKLNEFVSNNSGESKNA